MNQMKRRDFCKTSALLGLSTLFPASVFAADLSKVPKSNYGFATTADQVAKGIDLSGKTVLITGCNSGLGYESMKTMAAQGAHVIGTARTKEKAAKACDSVDGKTTPLVCELTDFDSIVNCANAVNELDKPIDILMCNAGIMALPKLEQVYGLEKQFVVNHLGHYILTRRLLGQVEAAKEGRIVVLSSLAYKNAPPQGINFDDLSFKNTKYRPFTAYGQSKLANALFSLELSRRYAGTSVTSNSIHPGVVGTNLGRYISGKMRKPGDKLPKNFKTAAQGASTQVYVAVEPKLKGITGYYFEDCNPVQPETSQMEDLDLAKKLWDVSEELTKAYLA